MILAIDFDGVIHDHKHPVEGKKMGLPMDGAVQGLKKLKVFGHMVIIHSCKDKQTIEEWMKFYGIPYYDSITNIKPIADVYLDDKAIRFENWNDLKL